MLSAQGFGARTWEAADTGEITHEQAPLVVRSLLSAGVDTTVNGLAAVLYAFLRHPRQWVRLRAEPSLARTAFDEAVRWESLVQTFFRTATRDVRIGDIAIPDGQKILMFLGAANRDPERWTDPDEFDLSRNPSGHVGFGMGIHECVGQYVARLESEALLTALVSRIAFRIGGSRAPPPQQHPAVLGVHPGRRGAVAALCRPKAYRRDRRPRASKPPRRTSDGRPRVAPALGTRRADNRRVATR
ncbi:cytochrome P450 [Nocardia sp. NPDC005366]|uniref:cytochrome P450 n=1 Tax=Nocardia sp. NPDC005366 TaxID=3156878 RepID=UPI0033B5B253